MTRSKVRIPVAGIFLPSSIKERCPGSYPMPDGTVFRVQAAGPAGCGRCTTVHTITYGYLEGSDELVSYRAEHDRYRQPDYNGILNHLLYGIYVDGWSLAKVKQQLESELPAETFCTDLNPVRPKKPESLQES